MAFHSDDVYYMNLAIEEAKKGQFTARPNPIVGCILIKNNLIIGRGFHPQTGLSHAEVFALQDAQNCGADVQGATAYVTLEPCSHTGRTPPCADALIRSGVSKVVVACLDANPLVSGRGVHRLEQAGIEVVVGVCEQAAHELNRGFLKAMQTGKPYVRLKMAMSLDGRIAMQDGESKWIAGAEAREDVQLLRAKSGAIITGSGTIIADNPALSVRSSRLGVPMDNIVQPKVAILDRRGRLHANSPYQVFDRADTMIWREGLDELLDELAMSECRDVLVEAGGGLAGAFIAQDLVDELIIYQAPCILGSGAKAGFELTLERLSAQKRFDLVEYQKIGQDLKIVLRRS
ncbi:bifunctional diaminohydroxyphosphoribosylaminopyrimidine deaminase/5-amino-6-(5-phosphoribosylamino)uracil reductase RibD [Moraxella haemolytica]|uniref:bifunctional diaminohydroxyphosphoribosylaminopyrimidine deaminase/5-amino-6-(5-phosphoribosylamino)uracil reductase RibD n=1 Tax=Moraxella haemolytica TaxID=2904119 RepID=UPI0025430401|nr:bifunctional diaminohydroxyphosphoribosylaminopyrimidine deaminase/5-amino-6-(5-phosphoribosylamino)uracil reductase RibD [Moraxella sp. ZY171148]